MSDNENEEMSDEESADLTVLEAIERVETILTAMKMDAATVDDNAAGAKVMNSFENLMDSVSTLQQEALTRAHYTADDFMAMLQFEYDADFDSVHRTEFWQSFNGKLNIVGKSIFLFREQCLHKRFFMPFEGQEGDGKDAALVFFICHRNPPAFVLKTLFDVTPPIRNSHKRFDHLARHGGEYPLNCLLRNGASLEAVELLLSLDKEKHSTNPYTLQSAPPIHVLTQNKRNYDDESFSDILRFLVKSIEPDLCQIAHKDRFTKKSPLLHLYDSLIAEGVLIFEIIANKDFEFLLKTAQLHRTLRSKSSSDDKLEDELFDKIRPLHAFIHCSQCFRTEIACLLLEEFCALYRDDLKMKDISGMYPLHIIVSKTGEGDFCPEMARTMILCCKEVVKLRDDKGRLPLHVACDLRKNHPSDAARFAMVKMLSNAYPEAIVTLDPVTNLMPFMLDASANPLDSISTAFAGEDDWVFGPSSTFYLLRECPEMLVWGAYK